MRLPVTLQINGRVVEATLPPSTLLVDFIREHQGLTGTHQGCDTAQCGACTVLVDGAATKSCNLLVAQVDGGAVTTIEGLAATDGGLHPMQQAFGRHHALQCGYCTPGMVMRGVAMAAEGVPAEPEAVRCALSGNLCRCTGYRGIVDAVCEGLRHMRTLEGRGA
ncbi:carbon monoxide dehydrogenase [Rhodoferax koreense]|uniref:Carbon monoxide dehydrogenase n=1 Tax=Rhodoferax koreensis TaxID=1842727 RepID=A0A1P8JR08_9BURK|nr:(2Fe-2S)-binding protein [Rhodoferax koreense]APW36192.1 carbon monoxide dehydrogenase [Rhodoferax koreense]